MQAGGRVDRLVGAVGIRDAGAQVVQPGGRGDGDLAAVDLGAAGQRGAEGVDRGDRLEDPLAGLAGQVGIDEHPLVAQPDHRAGRLGELVQLRLGQRRRSAQRNLPAEVERRVAAEESGQVARRPVRRGDRRPRGERPPETARPVQLDPGRRQAAAPPRPAARRPPRPPTPSDPVRRSPAAGRVAPTRGPARRIASVASIRARGPKPATSSAQTSYASRTSVGSFRLCSCTTALKASDSAISIRNEIRTPVSSPTDTSSAHDRSRSARCGATPANSPVLCALAAAGDRGIPSATASRNSRTRSSATGNRTTAANHESGGTRSECRGGGPGRRGAWLRRG